MSEEENPGAERDATGLGKRRRVVGGTYGPTRARQVSLYGVALALLAALVGGALLLAAELDQPRDRGANPAPWAQPEAPQREPRPLQ